MFGKLLRSLKSGSRPEPHGRPLELSAETPKLGLALSSGGARGLAHVGVLQVFEENGIEIHAIPGSSMGSYVGALWAAGFSGSELADLDTKERLVLRSGRISDAVHASCAMPGIIAPVLLNGRRCVDGGVVDPVPVGALHKFAEVDRVIAVSVIPTFEEVDAGMYRPDEPPPPPSLRGRVLSSINRNINFLAKGNIVDTFRQSIRCAQVRIAHDSIKRADLCLRPEHFSAPWNDYSNFNRYIEAGRKVALDNLDAIRALLETQPDEKSEDRLVGGRVA